MALDAPDVKTNVIVRSWYLGPSQGSCWLLLAWPENDSSALHTTVVSTAKHTDSYNRSTTIGLTIVPSGSPTTKNGFSGPATLDRLPLTLATDESSLTSPERVHHPDTIRFLILGLATTIAATITDERNKTILYKFVRFTELMGCRINARLESWL
jgi:hypothetical protein